MFSTGYIAGGTIGAVLINFLVFCPNVVLDTMGVWQYRTTPAPRRATFDAQCRALAREELGETAPVEPEEKPGATAGEKVKKNRRGRAD